MHNILFFKNDDRVTVYLNGEHRQIVPESDDELQTIIGLVKAAKQDPTDENIKELREFISPSARFLDIDGIEKTRTGTYYIQGTNAVVPKQLSSKIKEYSDLGIDPTPLFNFAKLLAVNPVDNVRNDLFKFAEKYAFPITDNGLFVAYKSVLVKASFDISAAKKISNMYLAVVGRRENPEDYCVLSHRSTKALDIELNEYKEEAIKDFAEFVYDEVVDVDEYIGTSQEEIIAEIHTEIGVTTLKESFKNMLAYSEDHKTSLFTDVYSETMSIKLGEPVRIDEEKVDRDPNSACSTGLHVGSPEYVKWYGGHDEKTVRIACLVNPANVRAVPHDESFRKMRVAEYFPFAIVELGDSGDPEPIESGFFESDYFDHINDNLDQMLENKSFNGEISEEEFNQLTEFIV